MEKVLSVLVDGLTYSSWLFLTAIGLTLIFGVMKILNMAHGSIYALGAYAAASMVGAWLGADLNSFGSYGMLVLAAVLVGIVVGPLLERGILQFMYAKSEIVLILVTYAIFLILEDVIKLIWGVESKFVSEPYKLLGSIQIGPLTYPAYNAILVAAAMLTGIGLTWFLRGTRQGKILLAVMHDREMSATMGINVGRVYLMTFTLGASLGALGGALTAPTVSVVPAMGVEVIVLAFAVIVIGGLGSFPGAALGAVIVGIVRSAAVQYLPEIELFSIYAAMAVVLMVRPEGLFASQAARKI